MTGPDAKGQCGPGFPTPWAPPSLKADFPEEAPFSLKENHETMGHRVPTCQCEAPRRPEVSCSLIAHGLLEVESPQQIKLSPRLTALMTMTKRAGWHLPAQASQTHALFTRAEKRLGELPKGR